MNFELEKRGSTIKTELIAGVTTFLTMVYIAVVNPAILSDAGVPFEQVFLATIIATVVGTLWMALFANLPIAIAPGMGLNAYFAYSVVLNNPEVDYSIAFAAVFVAGILFILLSLTKFRELLIESIPDALKYGITAGIGLFIAFIGFRMTGIIVHDETNLVRLGDLSSTTSLLAIAGLGATIILMALRVQGAIFYGMIITAFLAYFAGELNFTDGFVSMPDFSHGLAIANPFTAIGDVIQYGLYTVVFSFLIVTVFDSTGTMIGVANQAGLMKNGKFPRIKQALLADSVGSTVGAIFGTTPTTAYLESTSGVGVGGRTGITTITVATLFALVLFFSPIVSAVSAVSAITAPALILVGSFMMGNIAKIDWNKFEESFPAFLVILIMPLTSSIATGIAFGFISYPILKIVIGKAKEVHWLLYLFAVLFIYQLVFLPH